MRAMRGANGWFDGALVPVLLNSASDTIHIIWIAAAKVTTALTNYFVTRSGGTRSLREARGKIRIAAVAGDGVVLLNPFICESPSLAGGRERFFLVKLGNLFRIGFGFRRLGLWVFFVKAIGGIDCFTLLDDG